LGGAELFATLLLARHSPIHVKRARRTRHAAFSVKVSLFFNKWKRYGSC
jgi:hypothetical protein